MVVPPDPERYDWVTNPPEIVALRQRLVQALQQTSPAEVYREFLAENDALIRQPDLDHGRLIVAGRAAIHTELVRHWVRGEQRRLGYDKPFAVVALGGTGRAEVTPRSDLDYAFLFDDALDGNAFLLELQRQVLNTDAFQERYGFKFEPLPFNLDDVPRLVEKQLNSFIDLRPVHDPDGLAGGFLERIRATYDPFEHFLHVRSFWFDRWEKAAGEAERLDAFDIKNDGLRLFLAGIWTMGGWRFRHSHEVYAELGDPRVLEAYHFLLRIRCFVHSRRPAARHGGGGGSHPEDQFVFDDFTSFGELLGPAAGEEARFDFANAVRARLLSARRRVARFAKSVIARELTPGRRVAPGSPLLYRQAGLAHTTSSTLDNPVAKSRAALSLLLAAQHYEVPIDPAELEATFRDIGDWLVPVPELSALFYEEKGSLAKSFEFLAQFDGAQERLFPGYARFETSLDARVARERQCLRGVIERRKLVTLDQVLAAGREALARAVGVQRRGEAGDRVDPGIEAALLGPDALAGVKLALKTKRLPLTQEDLDLRADLSRPLHERFSSGLSDRPLAGYYEALRSESEFPEETLRVAQFLVANRRSFKMRADLGLNDAQQVGEFAELCGDEQMLRSLFVFTCVDRADWEGREQEPARWFSIDELYAKTLCRFRPETDPRQHLRNAGFSPAELAILEDFGPDLFGGVYRPYVVTFGTHLLRLAEEPEGSSPKAILLRAGASRIVGVAACDFRGLAACITGELWCQRVNLQQAHLFSSMHHGLALDFFHLAPSDQVLGPEFLRGIERAIQERRHINEADEATVGLPSLEQGWTSLEEWHTGLHRLRHESLRNASGLVYTLAYKIFRHLGGDIFGLQAQTTRTGAYVSIYLGLPSGLGLLEARELVRQRLGRLKPTGSGG